MRWESDRLNASVVVHPKPLAALRAHATLETRDGEPYEIEPAVLQRFAAVCAPAEQGRLRLPITLHFSSDVEDSAYLIDELACDVLRRLEAWGPTYPYRNGKMWIPASLAVDLLLRYRGALQRLML